MNNTAPSQYTFLGLHGIAILTALINGHQTLAILFLIVALITFVLTYTFHKPTTDKTNSSEKAA